jgi:hypothetical protein
MDEGGQHGYTVETRQVHSGLAGWTTEHMS